MTYVAEATSRQNDHADHFVGRNEQLAEMNSAFANTQEGRLTVLLIEGPSGIGKSTLVRRFLGSVSKHCPTAVVFSGRCYEFETVPYKGLDAVLDELCHYLQKIPDAQVQALLPRDAFLLPKLFPVLGRVKAISNAPARTAIVPDAQEVRQRAFLALREIFARLADRCPLVIWIDDLQWGDRDSSSFLAELCAPPQQPCLLLLLTYRSEEVASNATLQYLHQAMTANQGTVGNWRHIKVERLSRNESQQLMRTLVGEEAGPDVEAKILSESGGHPLFLQELIRFATSSTNFAGSLKELELQTVMQRRVANLSDFAREVLQLISIAVQPLSFTILFSAISEGRMEERAEILTTLVRDNLVRVSGTGDERKLEPYHDQVRSAVVQLMAPELRKTRHTQLATALAARPEIEPQVLVTHYREAGNVGAAREAALTAAEAATAKLAFERAAVFYEAALAMGGFEEAELGRLYREMADSLGKAGRGRESAYAYLKAADCGGGNDQFEMKLLAADQLMRSGYIDEAKVIFGDVAAKVGLRMPRNPRQALAGILLGRVRTRARFLFGLPKPLQKQAAAKNMRLEVLRTGGVILGAVDPVLATYFQVQYVFEAMRTREPVHLAIAFGIEASVRAAPGMRQPNQAFALMDRSEEIAVASGDPNALGLMYLFRAYLDYLLGRIPEGIRDSKAAISFLREHCTGVSWELSSGYVLLFWFQCWSGHVKSIREQLPQLLKEGAARGDVHAEVSLRLLSYVHYAYLSADKPHECIADCKSALERWSHTGYHLQHYGATFIQVESYLYLGACPRMSLRSAEFA